LRWLNVARSLGASTTGVAYPQILYFSISLTITEKPRHVFAYQTPVNPFGKFLTDKIPGLCKISMKIKEFIFNCLS